MATVAYKCPNCASPLVFDGAYGKMICNACKSLFAQEDIEILNAPEAGGMVDFSTPTAAYSAGDTEQMQAYHCNSCGAELITESTTTATECPYCGSPAILPDRIDGGIRPEKVVPFIVTKEEAQKAFRDYFNGKKLLPNIFKKDNQIAEMRKLYVPYWLFDCDAEGDIVYEAEKRTTRREGDSEVTTTEYFLVRRTGSMHFENIPVDASLKMANEITESLEPYDLTKAVPFKPTVLSGAMADHADVDSVECETRAILRVENSMANSLRNTVHGYSAVRVKRKNITSTGGKVTPVLIPVWLITTKKDGKEYTFAINGQTGKLTCNVPTDKKKAFLWGTGAFAGAFGLGTLLLYLLKMLGSGTLFAMGIVGLIVAFAVIAMLNGQLKQAVSKTSAEGYSQDGCQMHIQYDHFLYANTTRRKIETQSKETAA